MVFKADGLRESEHFCVHLLAVIPFDLISVKFGLLLHILVC